MKKLKLILPLFMLLLMLSGCGLLDEMRSQHALYYVDGIIQYDSKTYKRVDTEENEELPFFLIDRDKDLYITAPDVPVLLSQMGIIKHQPFINADRTVIYDGNYYLLEEQYDEILAKLQKEASNEENKP